MGQLVVMPDGTQHIFPDSATPAQMQAALSSEDTRTPAGPTPATPGTLGGAWDFAKNVGTGLFTNAPAAVVGTPRALKDMNDQQNYAQSPYKFERILQGLYAKDSLPVPPSYNDVRSFLTDKVGTPNYVPSTGAGRIVQGAATGLGAGAIGGPAAATAGALGGAAQQGGAELGLPPWAQAGLGLLTPMLAGGVYKGISTARAPLSVANQKMMAQKILDEAAVNPNAAIGQPPIPGAPSTLGQATGDMGTLALEKGIVNSSPKLQGQYNQVTQGANSAVSNDLQSNFTWPGRGDAVPQMQQASGDMFTALQNARKASSASVKNLWGQVDPNKATAFDTAPIIQGVDTYVSSLTKARSRFIPGEISDMLKGLAPKETLAELQDTRSAMLSKARGYRDSGKYDEANVVQGMANHFGDMIDNLQMPDPMMNPAYQAARDATKAHHLTFDDPSVEKALNAPPATTADTFLRGGSTGGLDSLVKATGTSAIPAARDWFMGGLAKAAESATPGVGGAQSLLATPFTRYLNKYKSLLNDDRLFTPDQRDIINRAAQQLDFSLRTERAGVKGGSNTYSLLSSDKYLETMLGKKGAGLVKLLSKAKSSIGIGVGGMIGGPAGSMIGGALTSGGGAGMYSKAAQNTLDLVHQAVLDPKFAAELRTFRADPTRANLTPGILRFFTSNPANPTLTAISGP